MKRTKAINIGVFILAICVSGIMLTAWVIDVRKDRQLEQERLEQEKIEQEREDVQAELFEKAAAMGEWEEVTEERAVEDIRIEQSVFMENLVLVIYREGIYRQENNRRRTYGFFLFSDGWVYTAIEYYHQPHHDSSEIIYGQTFNDKMWEHLSDWKCVGRISSQDLAKIKVNLWQAVDLEYRYLPGEGRMEEVPPSLYRTIDVREGRLYTLYLEANNQETKLPSFEGAGYILLGQPEGTNEYTFWVRTNYGVRYTKDEYINNVMQYILDNQLFIRWQETEC